MLPPIATCLDWRYVAIECKVPSTHHGRGAVLGQVFYENSVLGCYCGPGHVLVSLPPEIFLLNGERYVRFAGVFRSCDMENIDRAVIPARPRWQ